MERWMAVAEVPWYVALIVFMIGFFCGYMTRNGGK